MLLDKNCFKNDYYEREKQIDKTIEEVNFILNDLKDKKMKNREKRLREMWEKSIRHSKLILNG